MLSGNVFFEPTEQIIINPELQQQLHDMTLQAKATRCYLTKTILKMFRILKNHSRQKELYLKYYFEKVIQGINGLRIQKVHSIRAKPFFYPLKSYFQQVRSRRNKYNKIFATIAKNKQKKIFYQIKNIVDIQNKSKALSILRKKQGFQQLIYFMREDKQKREFKRLQIPQNNIVQGIYAKNLISKSFKELSIHAKQGKIKRMLRKHLFAIIKNKMNTFNRLQNYKSKQVNERHIKKRYFYQWKSTYQELVSIKFYSKKIVKNAFNIWKTRVQSMIYSNKIQISNNCIVNIFLQRLSKTKMQKIIRKWRNITFQGIQSRRQANLQNRYADIKNKQILLRKYFKKLKLNCINCRIQYEYYEIKLKTKALDGFKIFFNHSIKREEKLIQFIDNREIKKYFYRILQFNRQQIAKVRHFKLSRIFKALSYSIISQYYQKYALATNYSRQNLLYKSIFALKSEVSFRNREQYAIAYLNIIRPLRIWNKGYRLRSYIFHKQWRLKKDVIRVWKLMLIKIHSERKIVKQFREQESAKKSMMNQSKIEAFQFENIMETIAKIRQNFNSQRLDTMNNNSGNWPAIHTPSLQYSIENQ